MAKKVSKETQIRNLKSDLSKATSDVNYYKGLLDQIASLLDLDVTTYKFKYRDLPLLLAKSGKFTLSNPAIMVDRYDAERGNVLEPFSKYIIDRLFKVIELAVDGSKEELKKEINL